MKNLTIKLLVLAAFLFASSSDLFAQRIRFARGRTSATVTGKVTGGMDRGYFLAARYGQYLSANVSSRNGCVIFDRTRATTMSYVTRFGDNFISLINTCRTTTSFTLTVSINYGSDGGMAVFNNAARFTQIGWQFVKSAGIDYSDLTGTWAGTLENNGKWDYRITLSRQSAGKWKGTILWWYNGSRSNDFDTPVTFESVGGKEIRVTEVKTGDKFDGTVSGNKIEVEFTYGTLVLTKQ